MNYAKYLIIGNGIAGLSAAKEIRKNDDKDSLTIVSSEPSLTYYRTKLTEGIALDLLEDDLLMYDEKWYEERDINVILNKIVEKIDIDNNQIELNDGQKIKYEKLLIAAGSSPFTLPIEGKSKQGTFALRTTKDLEEFKEYIKYCETVTVIGGGLLGLEAAWSLKLLKKNVNVIEHSPYLLHRQLDRELGEKLAEKLSIEGINIYLPNSTEEILGDDKVNGIRINGGEIVPTDAILFSTGIRANLNLVKDSGIVYNRGIKVNECLETNVGNIYAAGDVAEIGDLIMGLWTASNEQGQVAGSNMSGVEKKYEIPKMFSTLNIGNIKVFSAGDIVNYDKVLEYKDESKDIHHKLFTRNGEMVGVILFGDLQGLNALRNGVFKHTKVEDYLAKGIQFK